MESQRGEARNGPSGGGSPVEVLLAADNVPARLTLEAVLEKSGYLVDSAASSAEAMDKLENGDYSLVLCDLRGESSDASESVLQLARAQEYHPATARLEICSESATSLEEEEEIWIEPVDVPGLLTQITNLLAGRAVRRSVRC